MRELYFFRIDLRKTGNDGNCPEVRSGSAGADRTGHAGAEKNAARARRGTTLIELLAAVAVLVFFGLIVNTGLNLALNSYHTMTSEAETQLLLSTAAAAVTDELRYARSIETDGEKLRQYVSETFGYYCEIAVDENGQLVVREAGMDQPLLSSGVYGRDSIYSVELPDGIRYDSDTGIFSFQLSIKEKNETRAEADFQVYCLSFVPADGGTS